MNLQLGISALLQKHTGVGGSHWAVGLNQVLILNEGAGGEAIRVDIGIDRRRARTDPDVVDTASLHPEAEDMPGFRPDTARLLTVEQQCERLEESLQMLRLLVHGEGGNGSQLVYSEDLAILVGEVDRMCDLVCLTVGWCSGMPTFSGTAFFSGTLDQSIASEAAEDALVVFDRIVAIADTSYSLNSV